MASITGTPVSSIELATLSARIHTSFRMDRHAMAGRLPAEAVEVAREARRRLLAEVAVVTRRNKGKNLLSDCREASSPVRRRQPAGEERGSNLTADNNGGPCCRWDAIHSAT